MPNPCTYLITSRKFLYHSYNNHRHFYMKTPCTSHSREIFISIKSLFLAHLIAATQVLLSLTVAAQVSGSELLINSSKCPAWTNESCACGSSLYGKVNCQDGKGVLAIANCFCMTTAGEHDNLKSPLVADCLFTCTHLQQTAPLPNNRGNYQDYLWAVQTKRTVVS